MLEIKSPDTTPQNILVIRFGSMGDVVLTTPTLRFLRSAWPKAKITFLVKQAFAPLLQGHPFVDELWVLPPGGEAALRQKVAQGGFDRVLDLHANLRSRWMASAAGCAVWRIRNHAWQRRRRVWLGNWGAMPPPVALRGILAAGGDAGQSLVPCLYPSVDSKRRVAALLRRHRVQGRPLALCPGSAWKTKQWPLSKVVEAVEALPGRVRPFLILVGGPQDTQAGAALAQAFSQRKIRCADLTGQVALGDLAALLQACKAALTNDSGPMHVATAVGTPVVAVFGSTVEAFGFYPRGPRDQVLELPLSCRPCHPHGLERCPLGHHQCMEGISPQKAALALEKTMRRA